MARFSKYEVINRIHDTGMVPIFYNPDIQVCKKVLKACYNGGLRVFEFTNRGDFAHEVFGELNKFVIKEYPDLILGAGSIVDPATTSLYIQLGANFIVAPLLNKKMGKICNRRKIPWVPGCGSVTEISMAEEMGADIVKVFPVNLIGGAKLISAIKGPMPWVNLLATGGVDITEDNLKEWFEAGVACVGMGSKLFPKDIIKNGEFEKLEEIVRNTLKIISSLKTQ